MGKIHSWAVMALSATMLTGTAACGGTAETPSTGGPKPSSQSEVSGDTAGGASILEEAEKAGASVEQLTVLQHTAPTFDEYRAAVYKALDCMEKAGVYVQPATVDNTQGYPLLSYSWGTSGGSLSEDQAKKLGDGCLNKHSKFVEMAYQTSPRVAEIQEKRFAPYRKPMVDCLTKYGVEIDPKATRDQLAVASEKERMKSGRSCLDELQVPL